MRRPDVSAQDAAAQAGRMRNSGCCGALVWGVAEDPGVERNQCR